MPKSGEKNGSSIYFFIQVGQILVMLAALILGEGVTVKWLKNNSLSQRVFHDKEAKHRAR